MNIDKQDLTEENFKFICAKYYDGYDICAFEEDMSRLTNIRKLLRRYGRTGEINIHLVLNHVIIMFNGFGDFFPTMFYYIMEENEYNMVNAFLLFLQRMPENGFKFGVDINLTKKLEEI